MKLATVIEQLKAAYPPQLAMDWDNPGLQTGRTEYEIRKVLVALDATREIIDQCIEEDVDLLVTHHPLIMKGIRSVSSEDFLGEKALTMAEHRIAHYAMHTNYDVTTMKDLAGKMLQLSDLTILEQTGCLEDGSGCGIGCVGNLPEQMTAEQCCAHVKKAFGLASVRLFGDVQTPVRKMAVCPGAGRSDIGAALASGADIYVTGDISHHDGIDAVDQGLLVIDAGHYGVEHIFIGQMTEYLRKTFPQLQVEAAAIRHPFQVL
jgi:dinuclear metal center YbgI/SA1388 family protein